MDDVRTTASASDRPAAEEPAAAPSPAGFTVNLDVYSGPFDVLLGMVAHRRLELTEVSLSAITEEFLAYVRGLDVTANMDEASSFLDVASILVEAKSAALLPADLSGERDELGMEALRERDLLFARLLQYRAYKQAAVEFRARIAANRGRFPHPGELDESITAMLPELVWTIGADDLASIAARVFADVPAATVSTRQLHVPLVDLEAQAALVRDRLRALDGDASMTFAELTADADGRAEVVARFLAVLMFFKQGSVRFRQSGPYATLHLKWAPDQPSFADGAGAPGVAAALDDTAAVSIDERDFA